MIIVKLETSVHTLNVTSGQNPLDPSKTTDTYDSRGFSFDDEDDSEDEY